MAEAVLVRNNAYYDSATLMSISQRVKGEEGVTEAVAVMGSQHNKELLEDVGLGDERVKAASPRDLILAVRAESDERAREALEAIEESLTRKSGQSSQSGEPKPTSLAEGFEAVPETNLALISVPGEYAAREAEIALDHGKHVMMFSDNVPLEAEIRLKKKAADKGLLMMGPDCGTAIINGVPLAFANVVRRGPIGVVAAAGTGLQEVSSLVHRYGSGISQGIGTGGRDVKDKVGGLLFLPALDALLEDDETETILLVSKPTGEKVLNEVANRIKESKKPVVVAMLGGDRKRVEEAGGKFAEDLEEGARLAVEAAGTRTNPPQSEAELESEAASMARSIASGRRYLRALYTGGTLCYETLLLLSDEFDIESNVPLNPEQEMADSFKSEGHAAVDLGEDEFTQGRPHPMMEPSLRTERIEQEAKDPETAVLLLDFVLGYGSHDDPAGEAVHALQQAAEHGIAIIASVTGTDRDPQDYGAQVQKLQEAGARVFASNAEAARFTRLILRQLGKGDNR